MLIKLSPEQRNFLLYLSLRPYLLPYYLYLLLPLIFRRAYTNLLLQSRSDPHKGLRRRPPFLYSNHLSNNNQLCCHFPPLHLNAVPLPDAPTYRFSPSDPESHLSRNRWSDFLLGFTPESDPTPYFNRYLAWSESSPPLSDPSHEPYSTSERVCNLIFLLCSNPSLQVVQPNDTAAFIHQSASWIYSRLEYIGPARYNNHLLNNARALYISGCILRENHFVSSSLDIINHIVPRLFDSSGCLREGSTHYHLLVSSWLFDIFLFSKITSTNPPSHLIYKIGAKAAYLCSLLCDHLFPTASHIGDISPDLSPVLTIYRLRLLHSSLLSSHVKADFLDFFYHQYHGSLIFGSLPRHPKYFPTHSHQDATSFIWKIDNLEILIDPGRVDYRSSSYGTTQTQPELHNTLTIDGLAPYAGSLLSSANWQPEPYSTVKQHISYEDDTVILRHNGFSRVQDLSTHTRRISHSPHKLTIVDTIDGSGFHLVTVNFVFAPHFRLLDSCTLTSPYGTLSMHCQSTSPFVCSPRTVYSSPCYNSLIESTSLVFSACLTFPASITTTLGFSDVRHIRNTQP